MALMYVLFVYILVAGLIDLYPLLVITWLLPFSRIDEMKTLFLPYILELGKNYLFSSLQSACLIRPRVGFL